MWQKRSLLMFVCIMYLYSLVSVYLFVYNFVVQNSPYFISLLSILSISMLMQTAGTFHLLSVHRLDRGQLKSALEAGQSDLHSHSFRPPFSQPTQSQIMKIRRIQTWLSVTSCVKGFLEVYMRCLLSQNLQINTILFNLHTFIYIFLQIVYMNYRLYSVFANE